MIKQVLWKYKNTILVLLSLLTFLFFLDSALVQNTIRQIGAFGYIGSILTGIFFVSTFTVAPATVVLYHLAQVYNPFLIAITAGFGAMIGDLFIFRFFKSTLLTELAPLIDHIKKQPLFVLFESAHFGWLTPVIGAIIIASPFPDEIGIGMMGLSRISVWQFAVLTFVFNALGILVVVLFAQT
jgi:uncharacterized membrane protein YdjX (TVP38/TMEM64 family)